MCQSETESSQVSCFKFDEFLVENIYSQLVNFHTARHFIFKSYLDKMFMFFNEENFQSPEILFTSEIRKNTFNYMNLIMEKNYKVMFQNKLPKVPP